MPVRVCAVTSTRADWGLLIPHLNAIRGDTDFDLRLIVTGQHLIKSAGNTLTAITDAGFRISAQVDMELAGDSAVDVTASLGCGIDGIGQALADLKPDLLFVLGDRYEILGAVMAATLARIPVVHCVGGDITEGAVDDAFRHAMTKMSHLHFTSTESARRRVCQMGENPNRVFNVGSSGIDLLLTLPLMDRAEFFEAVALTPRPKNIMVTFHPETLAFETASHCGEMLTALDQLGPNVGLIFSGTNTDVQGLEIGRLIEDFVKTHDNSVLHASLGSQRYLSALKYCDMVVGNSSSGIYEAPSFNIPTINIGDRQKGRERAQSVIDVAPRASDIYDAIQRGFALDCSAVHSPYGDGHAAENMLRHLKHVLNELDGDPRRLLKKQFYEWPAS